MKKTYFNHDSTARNDIRIIKLRSQLGYEGYGIFWAVLELLFTEENKICTSQYDIIAYGLQCNPSILKQVIEDFDLFVTEDGCFYSRRLNNHIEEINNKSSIAKQNAKKRWNNATVMQQHSNSNASKVKYTKEDNTKLNNILIRLEAFQKTVFDIKDIDINDKKAFVDYWTEANKSGTKMRFEMEKTWDLKRRLSRWVNSSFNKKEKSRFPDYYDSLLMKRLDESAKKEYEQHLKNLGYISEYNPNAGAKWIKK
tara:strand:+ start:1013 stop:1774 length:762 start_codon:yes stop_codon:yes gene_type:complete